MIKNWRWVCTFSFVLSWVLFGSQAARADFPPLIPRAVLFGSPAYLSPEISPDGAQLAYLAPSKDGVLNVWARTIGKHDDIMVTHEVHRPIYTFFWSYDSKHLFYLQDSDGDENYHVYSVNLNAHVVRDLTPFHGIKADNLMLDRKHPDEMLVGLNLRDRHLFDIYRIDLRSGSVKFDTQNPGDVDGWLADSNFVIRVAVAENPVTGEQILRVRDEQSKPWRNLVTWSFEDSGSASPIDFSMNGKSLYVVSPKGFDTARLVEMDSAKGHIKRTLSVDPHSDLSADGILENPVSHRIEAVQHDYLKPAWSFLDPGVRHDFAILAKVHEGVIGITSRSLRNDKWIVSYMADNGPIAYYAFDRTSKKAVFLFVHRPELAKYTLSHRNPVVIRARDGLNLVSYLTLPSGVTGKNFPMVLYVHGGPWARDEWGYDPLAQWLANRGYAVLQVNYRGSTGFGKKFLNAGNLQWPPGKMLDDLTDAVNWAMRQGIADPKRVAIFGGSYGGYATLAGLTFTPELYACGVDEVGPSEVKTLLESFPPYWKPFRKMFFLRVGDVEKDEILNHRISPLYHIDNIHVPLLIGQGVNDPRVNIVQSNQIVDAMRKKGLPVTYVVYPDEGHGFARPQNNLDFFGRAEDFFAKYLVGRAQPWEKVPGSTAELR